MLTATNFAIAADVTSSAISRLEIVRAEGDAWAWDLLVTFTSSDKVYRYAWDDEGECERWFYLLNDENDKAATSWGREFHRALRHGDIEQIEV